MKLVSGAMLALKGSLGLYQRIYTRGDSGYGASFTIEPTFGSGLFGGDDVNSGSLPESSAGTSWVNLAPQWTADNDDWTIFGGIFWPTGTWPPTVVSDDIPIIELQTTGGVRQAAIHMEPVTGDVFIMDSAGSKGASMSNVFVPGRVRLIVAAVQLKNSGDSEIWSFRPEDGDLRFDGVASGNDFQTAGGLTLQLRVAGQNHGGSPYGSPTHIHFLSPFAFHESVYPDTDRPSQIAGLNYVSTNDSAVPPWEYDGTDVAPQTGSSGKWIFTANESATDNLTYPGTGNGGMDVLNGPLNDPRVGPLTEILGAGVCFHSDVVGFGLSPTSVSAGRDAGVPGSISDHITLVGLAYGGGGANHGTTLIVDNIRDEDNLAGGFRAPGTAGTELNAMRGWVYVDPSTLLPQLQVKRRRIEGHA